MILVNSLPYAGEVDVSPDSDCESAAFLIDLAAALSREQPSADGIATGGCRLESAKQHEVYT